VTQSMNNPQCLNRYSYCRNNPTSRIDPSGHDDLDIYNTCTNWAEVKAETEKKIIEAASHMSNGGGDFLMNALDSLDQLPQYLVAMMYAGTSGDSVAIGLWAAAGAGGRYVQITENTAPHMFQEHHNISDTPVNRKLLENVANNESYFEGVDRYGKRIYSSYNSKGQQVWTFVNPKTNTITNGGINKIGSSFMMNKLTAEWEPFNFGTLIGNLKATYGQYLPPYFDNYWNPWW
jgi:hypothetical protein